METIQENQINLLEINPNELPELQGWREKQIQLVEDNPFIEITDNTTYKEAKARRTALVSGRTKVEKQDKLIASMIKNFRINVSESSKELVEITLPHEQKQQEEVKRYETQKAEEKAEKLRIEEERKVSIENKINSVYGVVSDHIALMNYESIEETKNFIKSEIETAKEFDYQEFEGEFTLMVEKLKLEAENVEDYLVSKERQRKEKAQLAEERKQLEAEKEAQRLANAKAKRLREEEENKLIEERKIIEAEKKRLDKIESDRLAKEKAAREAKELEVQKAKEEEDRLIREDAERKRIEALKPEKEKLVEFVNSLQFSNEVPVIKDKQLHAWLMDRSKKVMETKRTLINEIENLK